MDTLEQYLLVEIEEVLADICATSITTQYQKGYVDAMRHVRQVHRRLNGEDEPIDVNALKNMRKAKLGDRL